MRLILVLLLIFTGCSTRPAVTDYTKGCYDALIEIVDYCRDFKSNIGETCESRVVQECINMEYQDE